MTESEFLTEKSKAVEAALRASVKQMISRAEDAVNPAEWTRDHPIIATSAALLGGFFLARELREMRSKRVAASANPAASEGNVEREVASAGWMTLIAKEIYDLAKPVIRSVIASKMAEAVSESQNGNAAQNGDHPQNGHVPKNGDSDNQPV